MDEAIVEAVFGLLAERGSIARVSVDAVARRARVSKAAIYRRWRTKEAMLLEAFATVTEPLPELPGVSVRDDLIAILEAFARTNAAFAERYRSQVVEPRWEVMRQVLRRGMATGELRADLDVERVRELLLAPLMYHMTVTPADEPVPDDLPAYVVDTVLRGIAERAPLTDR